MQSIHETEQIDDQGRLKAFELTLRPRRSADPRVAYAFCGALGLFWFIAALFFTLAMGGWPLFGFFGGEFIFIAGMVHVFIRRTEIVETVHIGAETIHVTRRDLSGKTSQTFPTYWARLSLREQPRTGASLEVCSHGKAIEIGQFLTPAEKTRIARKMEDILGRLKLASVD